jgi:MFS family permease
MSYNNHYKLQQKDMFLMTVIFRNIFESIARPNNLLFTSFMIYLGLADYEIGYIISFIALTNVLQIFSPILYERFKSPKKVVLLTRSLRLVFFYLLLTVPFLHNYRFVILLLIIVSSASFNALMGATFIAWNDGIIPKERKGRYFSNMNVIFNATAILASLFFGKVLDCYKHTTNLFMIIFSLSIIFAVLEILLTCKLEDNTLSTNGKLSLKESITIPLKDSSYRGFIIFSLLWMFAVSFATPFFKLYAIRYIELSYGYIAIVGSITSVFKIIMAKPWGAGVDRFGYKNIMKYTGICFAVTHFLWIFISAGGQIIYFIFIFFNGIFVIGFNISKFNINLSLSNNEHRLAYMGVNAAIMAIFSFVSTNISTLIIQYTDMSWSLFGIDIFQLLFIFAGFLYLLALAYILRKDI